MLYKHPFNTFPFFSQIKQAIKPQAILLSAVCSVGVMSSPAQASTVFINEFHYDNDGSDINEGVEITALAGTVIDDWQLLFYNGTNGSVYKIENLDGTFSNQSNGYGFLSFSISGLQNGAADGLALVDNLGSVVEFLSYEGQLTATDGTASGLTSIDIGIAEPANTAIGQSLQRTGAGQQNTDFIWILDTASFGQINSGQSFSQTSAVPIPASIFMFASALSSLMIGKARKKRQRNSLLD